MIENKLLITVALEIQQVLSKCSVLVKQEFKSLKKQ